MKYPKAHPLATISQYERMERWGICQNIARLDHHSFKTNDELMEILADRTMKHDQIMEEAWQKKQ